jgi:hypothetical protein
VRALGQIKQSAARVNKGLGVLDATLADAIIAAAQKARRTPLTRPASAAALWPRGAAQGGRAAQRRSGAAAVRRSGAAAVRLAQARTRLAQPTHTLTRRFAFGHAVGGAPSGH